MTPSTESDRNSLFAAVIPCQGDSLLLPQALVAATLNFDALTLPEAAPDWMLGSVRLAGERIAVLRFELLSGAANSSFELQGRHRRSRLVVLRADSHRPAFCLLASSNPRLINLTAAVLQPQALRPTDAEAYCLQRVQLSHSSFLIPNVDALAALAKTW